MVAVSLAQLFALDLAAISLLTFGLFFPRHRNRDIVVALLGINIAVLGITQALSSAEISAGLGLGLFGVLSIVRLRSTEMDQSEVAYYFAALSLGLLGGFHVHPSWLSPVLMGAVVVAIGVGDHPNLYGRHRQQIITLDRAFLREADLIAHLAEILGAEIRHVRVRRVDLVRETTMVDVRYRLLDDTTATQ